MGFRDKHDVFVIGEEILPSEAPTPGTAEETNSALDQEPDRKIGTGLDRSRVAVFRRGPRLPAALAAGALLGTFVVLMVRSGSGGSEQGAQKPSGSGPNLTSRSPLIAEPPAHTVQPNPLPSHMTPRASGSGRDRDSSREREQEREPHTSKAPTSAPSPLPMATPDPAPSAVVPPPPPSPPPPRSGGGSGVEAEFGFER
jgi:hypothetical protein